MSDTKGWTADRVRQHLQNAVYLEMWTVPLYLTAAYSIAAPMSTDTFRPEFAPVPSKPDGSPDFSRFSRQDYNQYAFNSILSVAIQEMLHVELAANILNAVRPQGAISPAVPWVKFTGTATDSGWAPIYSSPPPVLDAALPPGVALRLGPMDLNQARLFQWIEEEREEPGDPQEYRERYSSIGAFYTSLQYGATACWNDLYPPAGLGTKPTAEELLQKNNWSKTAKFVARSGFLQYFFFGPSMATAQNANSVANALALKAVQYPFSITIQGKSGNALGLALIAMAAIQVQGEGAGTGGEIPPIFVPDSDDPDDPTAPIEIALDQISHWQRFTEILRLVQEEKVDLVQPIGQDPEILTSLQKALNESYSSFLVALEQAFASTVEVDLEAMRGLGNRTLQVWQYGGTPAYTWIDPNDFIHPAVDLHACQGLNMCAGKGANGSGTKPGDGDCSTAFFHACLTTNMCAGQGGCGYAGDSQEPADNWAPNFNSCQGKGGCGAPIPAQQVFSSKAPPELQYKDVWTHARQLMRERVPGFPTTDPPPYQLRTLLTPTSSKPSP